MKKSKKILILGAKGTLGSDLCFVFKKDKPICWGSKDLDITNRREVERKIKKLNPRIVINAAAYTNVEMAEKEFALAKKINVEAVKNLVEVCAEIDAIFVHYSTDYVFDGKKKTGYREKDKINKPINRYGLSKLLGEKEILKNKKLKYYLIRISWLFGSRTQPNDHKNFVQTILKLAKEKKASSSIASAKEGLKVVDDQFGKPTYTFDIAQATKKLLTNKKPFGIYHLPNEGITTWYKFAKEIIKVAGFKIKLYPCKTSEYQTLAKRPRYSILLNTKLNRLRSWKLALRDYLKGFVSGNMLE